MIEGVAAARALPGPLVAALLRLRAPVAVLLLAAATWPVASLVATAVGDSAWQIFLHVAAARGLDFGREVLYTSGPLGFLSFPMLVTPATGLGAFAFCLAVHVALVAVAFRAALAEAGWPGAVLAGALGGSLTLPFADQPVVIVLAAAAWALAREVPPRSAALLPALGVLAAFELLVKLNDGLLCLVVLALAAWRLRPERVRAELVLAASFGGALLVLWLATGNPLGLLGTWLRLSWHIALSYSQGMAIPVAASAPRLVAVWLLVLGVALAAARRLGARRGVAFALAFVGFAFAYFKEGYVRADPQHTQLFYLGVAAAALGVAWRTPALRVGAAALVAVAVVAAGPAASIRSALAVLLLLWVAVREARLPRLVGVGVAGLVVVAGAAAAGTHPGASARALHLAPVRAALAALGGESRLLVDGARRRRTIAEGRAAVRSAFPISPRLRPLLRGRTVDVEPWEASVAWAYGLRSRQEPLVQSYTGYDPTLDRFGADGLASGGAEIVLRRRIAQTVGQHYPAWEAPALVAVQLCDFRRVAAAGQFEVLRRAPDRCGPLRRLAAVSAPARTWVRVPPRPRPDDIVYARIVVRRSLLDRLEGLLYRPPSVWIYTAPERRFALVPATAVEPLIMRLPRPRSFLGRIDFDRFMLVGAGARVEFFASTLS